MATNTQGALGASGSRVALALAALYVIWGSTYLAIRVAVERQHRLGRHAP